MLERNDFELGIRVSEGIRVSLLIFIFLKLFLEYVFVGSSF